MNEIELVYGWVLWLLPLPIAAYWRLKPRKPIARLYLPYLPKHDARAPKQAVAKLLAVLIWLLLLLAAARPVWYGQPVSVQPKHRDMMLVVDLSYSMSKQDMKQAGDYIDRLSAVKNVLADFIQRRQGDRLGLVLFADHAYLQTPLTLDRKTVAQQLNQTVLRLIGTQTAIGEGIGLATKTFIDSDAPQRVMILLSDGSNTAGVLDPLEAAKIAAKYNTTIYTVGVGAGEMTVKDLFITRTINTAEDLDEKSLIEIARLTGGQYFRARDSQELATIYDTINQLEPISETSQTWRPQVEWFGLPLGVALLLSVCLAVIRRRHG
ncbi:vWA domain-containing protein [Vibrio sp.]|uniref:vWA domain-containing protein n=1 Tax=Vibrio sp. TaxID=678 RepID=UPI003D0F23FF